LKAKPQESPFFYADDDEVNKKYYNTNLKHFMQGYRKPSDEILVGNNYVLNRFDAGRSVVENFGVSLDSCGKVGSGVAGGGSARRIRGSKGGKGRGKGGKWSREKNVYIDYENYVEKLSKERPVGAEYEVLGAECRNFEGGRRGELTGKHGRAVSDQESVSQSFQKNGKAKNKDQDSRDKCNDHAEDYRSKYNSRGTVRTYYSTRQRLQLSENDPLCDPNYNRPKSPSHETFCDLKSFFPDKYVPITIHSKDADGVTTKNHQIVDLNGSKSFDRKGYSKTPFGLGPT
jgi:hypothetical protein